MANTNDIRKTKIIIVFKKPKRIEISKYRIGYRPEPDAIFYLLYIKVSFEYSPFQINIAINDLSIALYKEVSRKIRSVLVELNQE
jgi:hypothetical protein